MKKQITRRDFLKMAGLLPIGMAAPKFINSLSPNQQAGNSQNVVVVVFDTLSASHLSLYGYQRETTPNLARLAEKAVVYHKHYAGGNFTSPGTASLLTGTQPWTHRGFHHRAKVEDSFIDKNIFAAFHNFHRVTYSHNPLVGELLEQFGKHLDNLVPREKLLYKNTAGFSTYFSRDEDIADVSLDRTINRETDGYAYSLFLSYLYERYQNWVDIKNHDKQYLYPRGLPGFGTDINFLLEDATLWLQENLGELPQPFMGYFHFLPPHTPYRTHRDFYNQFKDDGVTPKEKPLDLFSNTAFQFGSEIENRILYDEYILYVDREFGKLIDTMDSSGIFENTWVILTSDHGEMFERGVQGHQTPLLYEPVIRIPLMIFEPGRKTRTDIHKPTSAIDVLPTLLHVTGQQPAAWTEGVVLPPFTNANPVPNRNVFVLEAKKNKQYAPFTVATTTLRKENYKLMYFFGYRELNGEERVELYDLDKDPEELNDLSRTKKEIRTELLHEMKAKLAEVNAPYQ